MRVNVENIKKLIKEKYRNNQKWFAEDSNIERSYLNLILNGKRSDSSPKICNAIIQYCIKNKLNYKNYIFFEENG